MLAPPQTPAGGAYSAPRPLPRFKGPTSKGMEGNGRGGIKGKGEGRGEVEGGIWPTQKCWCGAPYDAFWFYCSSNVWCDMRS